LVLGIEQRWLQLLRDRQVAGPHFALIAVEKAVEEFEAAAAEKAAKKPGKSRS
jgi:hypothetical protein